MSCGVGCRCGLDLMLLWLWCRPAAIVPVRPLAWELACVVGTALKRPKKKKKKKALICSIFWFLYCKYFHHSTMVNFKLPMWLHWIKSREKKYTISRLSWVRADSRAPLAFSVIYLDVGHLAHLLTCTPSLSVWLPCCRRVTVTGLTWIESGTSWLQSLLLLLPHGSPLLKCVGGPPWFKLWW